MVRKSNEPEATAQVDTERQWKDGTGWAGRLRIGEQGNQSTISRRSL